MDGKDIEVVGKVSAQFERVERFQPLQAGQYWKAMLDIAHEGITVGQVLLIESIKWVDNKAHTIVLRSHPSVYGKYVQIKEQCYDGTVGSRNVHMLNHSFLLEDFLSQFEFEPDHARIREEELRAIQNSLHVVQAEMIEAQSNPDILKEHIQSTLQARTQEQGGSSGALMSPDDFQRMAHLTLDDSVRQGISTQSIEAYRSAAELQHTIATIKSEWIQSKTVDIADIIQSMTPYFQEQAACAIAHTEDLRTHVKELMSGIESLSLYVGEGVEVSTIKTGQSADMSVPLTIVQRKLMMDEELALWADVDETFDHRVRSRFFDALASEIGLVDQIFPTTRCILVMATTRRDIHYSQNEYVNANLNSANRKVFLLARDGENIHLISSPVESHLGASRLFPSKDDQENIFRGIDGSDITFRDIAYTSRLAMHDAHALHYKRFLILMCGLDHRLNLFGRFYEGDKRMDFVSQSFQERYMRFLHDDDGQGLIGEENRIGLDQWMYENHRRIEPGSHVLIHWNSLINVSNAPGAFTYKHRKHVQHRTPVEDYSVAVVARREGKMVVFCDVVSGHSGKRSRVAVELDPTSCIESVLCLERLSENDIRYYLNSRDAREDHLTYVRLFKRALRYLAQQRQAEYGARSLISSLIHGNAVADVDAAVDQVISAWRVANKGKAFPLPKDLKALHIERLQKQINALVLPQGPLIDEVLSLTSTHGLTPLRLVINSRADMVLYAQVPEQERDNRLQDHPWVYCIAIDEGKRLSLADRKKWSQVILPRWDATSHVIQEWEEAGEWIDRKSTFQSYEVKQYMMSLGAAFEKQASALLGIRSDREFMKLVDEWNNARKELTAKSETVVEPWIILPIGTVVDKEGVAHELCVGRTAIHFLREIAPDLKSLQTLRNVYSDRYQYKEYAQERFDDMGYLYDGWVLVGAKEGQGLFRKRSLCINGLGSPAKYPLISTQLEVAEGEGSVKSLRIHPSLIGDEGCLVDQVMGISLPSDHEPVRLSEIKSTRYDIFDIYPIDQNVSFLEGMSNQSAATIGEFPSRAMAYEALRKRTAKRAEVTPVPSGMDAPDGYERFVFQKTS